MSTPLPAAEWIVQPILDFGAIRDDNILLTTAPHDSTSGYVAAARVDVQRNTETTKTTANGFVARSVYDSDDVDDKTDSGVRFDSRTQASERGTVGLDGEYRRETLFERVILGQEGVGDVRDVDLGLAALSQTRRDYLVLRPSWNYLLTERSSVRLSYRITDASFEDSVASGLFDYQEHLLNAGYSRQLNPRDDLVLDVNVSRFEPDVPDTEAQTLQLLVGMARKFSETLRGSASIGSSRTEERAGGVEDTSTGTVLVASLEQRAETSTFQGVLSRDVTPSGVGRALRTDQLRLYWTRGVAPTVDFVLEAELLRTRAIEGVDASADRRYYQISPQLRWQWLEDLAVVTTYRYRKQRYDVEAESADSSAVFLGVSYAL